MGCKNSKHGNSRHSDARSTVNQNNGAIENFNSPATVSVSNAEFDEKAIQILKNELNQDHVMFVLNNLLSSVMFFENYTKEMSQHRNTFRETESSSISRIQSPLQKKLLAKDNMRKIAPDCILETVSKHVTYRQHHGPKKLISEPIAPQRVFLINDLMDVVASGQETPEYASLDKPGYQFMIEYSIRKGFVKLEHLDDPLRKPKNIEILEEPTPGPSSQNDEDLYTAITNTRTPQTIEIDAVPVRRNTLPKSCFRYKKFRNTDRVEDITDFEDVNEEDLYEVKKYLSSQGYMEYFRKSVFPNVAGDTIGFNKDDITAAKWVPGKVFCTEIRQEGKQIPWEIIPAISIDWPTEHAFDFEHREERLYRVNVMTGENLTWPSDSTIKAIMETKAVVIPKGYFSKIGSNPENVIEWEICFPKAEHILQCTMTHAQIRCYLILLTIHKTLIEPITKGQGLLPDHIRTHIFWEMENNYSSWPDHRIATKLREVIRNFNTRLSENKLPDFFIKQKNMFENIPRKYLNYAHKIFHEILGLPLMHMISVARNIRYLKSAEFYPSLNFKELYKYLTDKNLITFLGQQKSERSSDPALVGQIDKEVKWKIIAQNKKKKNKENLKNSQVEEVPERKNSVDSINVEWIPEDNLNVANKIKILRLFIKNFIGIAKKSALLSTPRQTILYCKQVLYLAEILRSESENLEDEVNEFRAEVEKYEEEAKIKLSKRSSKQPPVPPSRTSLIFPESFKQDVKGKMLNLSTLNKSYTSQGPVVQRQKSKKLQRSTSVKIEPGENSMAGESPSSPTRAVHFV